MGNNNTELNLLLVSDQRERADLLAEELQQAGIDALVRRISYSGDALACAKRTGNYRRRAAPDLVIFDYSYLDEYTTDILRQLAFGSDKTPVPVVILTSPKSEEELLDGNVDGGNAVMFSPSTLTSFVQKLNAENRGRFVKALQTLYEYGPILVSTPGWVLEKDSQDLAMTA